MVLQIAITGLVATGVFLVQGEAAARSACYGGLISVVAAWMLGRGVLLAGKTAPESPGTGTWILYMSAALRFVLVLALFGVGLAMLELKPVPLISGFVAAQLSYLARFRDQPRSTGNSA